MKELSVEQKAKAYDEALEKARQLCAYPTTKPFISDLQDLFPELAESEDDRIRKVLLNDFKNNCSEYYCEGVNRDMIIDWLEKQGERSYKIIKGKNYFCVKTHNYAGVEWIKGTKYYASDNYTLVNQGCECYCPEYSKEEHNNLFKEVKYDGCVEKQGKPKPTDKVEPRFKVKYAGSEYNVLKTKDIAGVTFYGIEDEPNHIDYVKADNCEIISGCGIKESKLSIPTKPVMFSEQKPAWSKDDEKYWSIVIAEFSKYAGKSVSKDEWMRCNDWLNSLRDRVQPVQEWSEEDKDNFKHLMDEIVCLGNNRDSSKRLYYDRLIKFLEELKNRAQPREKWCDKDERMLDRLIAYFEKRVAFTDDDNPRYANWLKSLKPQSTWKPSDEQIEALESATENCAYSEYQDCLRELIGQLKKLKDETI